MGELPGAKLVAKLKVQQQRTNPKLGMEKLALDTYSKAGKSWSEVW